MTLCDLCSWTYPDDLVQDLITGGGRLRMCGPCALEFTNRLHGISRIKFDGKQAELLRIRALGWRKANPERGPQ